MKMRKLRWAGYIAQSNPSGLYTTMNVLIDRVFYDLNYKDYQGMFL